MSTSLWIKSWISNFSKTKRHPRFCRICLGPNQQKNICKESQNDLERAKNPVKSSGVQSDRLDNCQVFKDRKKLEIIKKLRKELVILKLEKGNGIVLIGTNDYYTAVENLFFRKK